MTVGEAGTILQSARLPVTGVRLGPLTVGTDGTAAFDAAGPTNQTWTVQASGELLGWMLLAELPGTNVTLRVVDPDSPNYKHRFYRGWAWFNRRHDRAGHLFQGRFKALVVEDDAGWQEVARCYYEPLDQPFLAIRALRYSGS